MPTITKNTNRNNNRNRSSSSKRDTIPSWLNAIDQVNQDMFGSSTVTDATATASTSSSSSPSLAYLKLLEEKLRRIPLQYWNHPPRRYPPSFASFCNRYTHANNLNNTIISYNNNMTVGGGTGLPAVPMLLVPSAVVSSKTPQATVLSQNPFAALQDYNQDDDDDDDDDDEYHEEEEYETQDDDDPSNHPNAHMNIRRLLLRILLSQSEIQGRLARDAVSPTSSSSSSSSRPLWNMGAQYISQAVYGLHQAVQIVDEQLSLWLSSSSSASSSSLQQQQQPQPLPHVKLLQEQDAHVLQVALDHYTRQEINFGKKAEMQKVRLEQRLLPQWESRDEIRERLGERKWKNNPNPKMDYAVKREQDEEELHEVERALEVMEEVKGRSRIVRDSVRDMVQEDWTERRSGGNGNDERGMHRYNGIRPTGATLHQRVSWEDYPDPTTFGWIFTGSNEVSRVEFFESMQKNGPKDSVEVLVKLDWYYTTATVKTSLDHPRQGKRQLFGAQVSPDVYVQILENPRAHTNVRYHTTAGGQSGRGVGSGRGGGRGRGRGGRGRGRGRGNGGFGRGRGGRGRGRGGV